MRALPAQSIAAAFHSPWQVIKPVLQACSTGFTKVSCHISNARIHEELAIHLPSSWFGYAGTAAAWAQWPGHPVVQKQQEDWGPRGGKQTRAPVQQLLLFQGWLLWQQAHDTAGPHQQLPVQEANGCQCLLTHCRKWSHRKVVSVNRSAPNRMQLLHMAST